LERDQEEDDKKQKLNEVRMQKDDEKKDDAKDEKKEDKKDEKEEKKGGKGDADSYDSHGKGWEKDGEAITGKDIDADSMDDLMRLDKY
jgi:hypothetical protein